MSLDSTHALGRTDHHWQPLMPRGTPRRTTEQQAAADSASLRRYRLALRQNDAAQSLRRAAEQLVRETSEDVRAAAASAGLPTSAAAQEIAAAAQRGSDGPLAGAALRTAMTFTRQQRHNHKATRSDERSASPEDVDRLIAQLDVATDALDVTEHLRLQLVRHLADLGESARSIATHVKASYNAVGDWIDEQRSAGPDEIAGTDVPALFEQLEQVDADASGQQRARRALALALLEAGVTGRQVAGHLGVTNHTAAKWAEKARAERANEADL